MKIGDRIYVRGYIDEIRKDTVIVRNDGGYFGTIPSEVITGELPSAQPDSKELSSTHKALDTISRQDAIRIVDGIDMWQAGWRVDAIESMKALPTAQPETHDKRTETHACDLISRQAAIDALLGITAMRNTIPLDSAIFNIKKLPSAQSEIIHCRDCKYWNPYSMECEGIGNWFGFEGAWEENGYCYKAERREDA